jgi:3-dehydroquinate synthase
VLIGSGRIAADIPVAIDGRKVFILCDTHTEPYARTLDSNLDCNAAILTLPPGEGNKSLDGYRRVLDWMLDHGVNRSSVLCAVGGGVIGDLGGFAAATVLRGIAFIQVPTTLLSMIDSAVGGKTGIDMPQGKNLVGAFHQPSCVVIDIDTLRSLPPRHMRAGYAEGVKHAVIGDETFFSWLETNGPAVLENDSARVVEFITRNLRIKSAIVAEDEMEQSGRRALLNFGHTFGHALETATGYGDRLLHGEAVALGMVMAAELSVRMGVCKTADAVRLRTHLEQSGLPVGAMIAGLRDVLDPDTLLPLMRGDKKSDGNGLTFILMRGFGDVFMQHRVDPVIAAAAIQTVKSGVT